MRLWPQDPAQPGRAVQGPSGSGTFHHQQPTSAVTPPASMAWTCSQGSLAGSPCSQFHTEAKTPQPWGLRKLGVGMVLQGGPTHSVSQSLFLSQGLCVLQGMCRALGRCSLTLAQAAWSLVSCGRTKHGPGGQGLDRCHCLKGIPRHLNVTTGMSIRNFFCILPGKLKKKFLPDIGHVRVGQIVETSETGMDFKPFILQ